MDKFALLAIVIFPLLPVLLKTKVSISLVACFILTAVTCCSTVIPSYYNYSTLGVLAANGSSATGAVIPHLDSLYTCATPTSSVLFDGVIPTLTALDGNTWARQLMIMQRARIGLSALYLYFDFTNTPGYTRVRKIEVVLFNCLQWGTAVREIRVSTLGTDPRISYK